MELKIFFHILPSTKSDTAAPKTLTSVFHGFLLFFFRIPHQLKHVHSSKSPPMKKIVEYHVPKNASFRLGQIGLLVLPIVSILESTVGYLCPFATERFWPYPRQQPRVKTKVRKLRNNLLCPFNRWTIFSQELTAATQ